MLNNVRTCMGYGYNIIIWYLLAFVYHQVEKVCRIFQTEIVIINNFKNES